MKRIKRIGPPFLIVALLSGVVGYILGCTNSQRERESQARAGQQETTNNRRRIRTTAERAITMS